MIDLGKQQTNAEAAVGPKGIAIIGFGPTKADAPWDDPAWTRWTMNDLYWQLPLVLKREVKLSTIFEMHPRSHYTSHKDYIATHEQSLASMTEQGLNVILAFANEHIPKARLYPLDEMVKRFGRRYFCSSVAFMVVFAISCIEDDPVQFAPRLGMFGCDMGLTSDWAKERACVEYWLRAAEERGIELVVPSGSPLLKSSYLYGYETAKLDANQQAIDGRKQELQAMLEAVEAEGRERANKAAEIRGMLSEQGWAEVTFTDKKPNSVAWGER
jgi:hypothetical protein